MIAVKQVAQEVCWLLVNTEFESLLSGVLNDGGLGNLNAQLVSCVAWLCGRP